MADKPGSASASQSKLLADRERLREKRESLAAAAKKEGATSAATTKTTATKPLTSRLMAPTAGDRFSLFLEKFLFGSFVIER